MKWEYLRVYITAKISGDEEEPVLVASIEDKKKVIGSSKELMNELGKEEWEMVGFQNDGCGGNTYFFKRERQ